MDDDDFDDRLMDDWEEDSFDEEVDDHSDLGTPAHVEAASFDDDMEDEEEFDQPWSTAAALDDDDDEVEVEVEEHEETGLFATFDGDGSTTPTSAPHSNTGGGRMGWSAWDVGTVFALGGWLADHHAERTDQQVAAALAERNIERPASGTRLGAANPPPSSSYPYQAATGTLRVEDPLDQGALFSELTTAEAKGQDLMIQAEGPVDLNRNLVLIISAVPGSSGPRFWVVAEEHVDGFRATRLIPIFERNTASGVAIFATDHAHEAVDAAVWACQREGLPLAEFHVAIKQSTPRPANG